MTRKTSIENEQLTDTTYYILLCLTESSHGYALMGKIQEISSSTFIVGPASMYTNLKKLLDAGLVEIIEPDKKIYRLTPKGSKLLLNEYDRRHQIVLQSKNIIKKIRGE
nr:PadR family transcriptional regulator [uncultured Caproiciproducens sp.]